MHLDIWFNVFLKYRCKEVEHYEWIKSLKINQSEIEVNGNQKKDAINCYFEVTVTDHTETLPNCFQHQTQILCKYSTTNCHWIVIHCF